MGTFFNSKIKISLLILMLSLIWRQRQCTAISWENNEDEQRSTAFHYDIDVYNSKGLSKHNESDDDCDGNDAEHEVAKDQFDDIKKQDPYSSIDDNSIAGAERFFKNGKMYTELQISLDSKRRESRRRRNEMAKENFQMIMKQTTLNEMQHHNIARGSDEADSSNTLKGSIVDEYSVIKDPKAYADDNNIAREATVDDVVDDVDDVFVKYDVNDDTTDMNINDETDESDGNVINTDDHTKRQYKRMKRATNDMDVTESQQYKLIYEFAIKYKRIPRITYFTCQRKGNAINSNDKTEKQKIYEEQQSWLSFNVRTMKLLKEMNAATSTTASTETPTETSTNPITKPTYNGNGYDIRRRRRRGLNAKSNNDDGGDSVIYAEGRGNAKLAQNTPPMPSSVPAPISSVTSAPTSTSTQSIPQAKEMEMMMAMTKKNRESILIKVVQIDQLVNVCSYNNNNNSNKNYNYNTNTKANNMSSCYFNNSNTNTQCSPQGRKNNGSRIQRSRRSNKYNKANMKPPCMSTNWLEAVLRPNMLRQIIVLDLSCGAASRKLIKMASRRALFSCAYHWLLIEDYAFNGQTGNNVNNNDSNNIKNNDSNNINDDNIRNNNDVASDVDVEVDHDDDGDVDVDVDVDGNKKYSNIKVGSTNRQQLNLRLHQQQQHQESIDDDAAKLALNNIENVEQKSSTHIKSNATVYETTSIGPMIRTAETYAATAKDEENMQIIEKFLEKINININTELILAKRMCSIKCEKQQIYSQSQDEEHNSTTNTNDNSRMPLQKKDYFMLYDVWNPGLYYGGKLNISEIGQFTFDDGIRIASWYRGSTTVARRKNMKLVKIRSIMVITNKNRRDTLEHYLTTHYDTHLDSVHRFNFALLSLVRDLYNFSLITSATPTWGYVKNGRYDGMIGAVVRKQADICGSPMFFYMDRAKVIDYTAKVWVARPCFIFRHPRNGRVDRIVFLQPFENKIWILLILAGIATIILLWILTAFESNLKIPQQNSNVKSNEIRAEDATKCRLDKKEKQVATNTKNIDDGQNVKGLTIGKEKQQQNTPIAFNNEQNFARKKHQQKFYNRLGKVPWTTAENGIDGIDGIERASSKEMKRYSTLMLGLDAVMFYIGSICQQGLTFSTSFISGRCIIITSLLFAFAIFQFYSASVVGTLLMERPKTIRTVRDLIRSSLEIGIEDIPYSRDYFRRTKDPDAIELYAKKMINTDNRANISNHDAIHSHEVGVHVKSTTATNWYAPEPGMLKVKEGKFAFHVDVATAYKIISDTFSERAICELSEIEIFPDQNMVGCLQKGSPLRKMITYGLRRINEAGLMDYQRKVWHSPKPRCVKRIHTEDLHVDMETVTSALVLLLFGFGLSLLWLCFEILHYKLWHRFDMKSF